MIHAALGPIMQRRVYMKNFFSSLLFLFFITCTAVAGDVPKMEIFTGYSIQRLGMPDVDSTLSPIFYGIYDIGFTPYLNSETSKYQKFGFDSSFTFNVDSIFGIEADFKYNTGDVYKMETPLLIYNFAQYSGYPYYLNTSASYTNYSFLAGPRFALRKFKTVTPFAHALMGFDHAKYSSKPLFSNVDAQSSKDTGFGLSLGGGIDLNVTKHFAVRLIQADYFLTKHNDFAAYTDNTWNNMALAFGAVFRFGEAK